MKRAALLLLLACGPPAVVHAPGHSSSIAVSADGLRVFVVNPESDSVSILDAKSRALVREVLLADGLPVAAADGSFAPRVMPRTLVVSVDGKTLFVGGERSGRIHAIDLQSFGVRASDVLGSEPFGLLLSGDGADLYVSLSQDARVARVKAATLKLDAMAPVGAQPWALAWSADGKSLLVTDFLAAQVLSVDPATLAVRSAWTIAEAADRGDPRLANGVARSLYDVAAQPGSTDTWVAHSLFSVITAQPALDFESSIFPAFTVFDAMGAARHALSTDAQDVPGLDGAISDVVSGPRAIVFTDDGKLALVADANSEDILVLDTVAHRQASLLRPLPGHLPEGLALSPDGATVYVDERASGDVAVLKLQGAALSVAGTIRRWRRDPMPEQLRLGMRLFHSANSDEFPLTTNHWVACASCHPEGRSDAVTWRFFEGPRDTPSNAGGMKGTGFLLRTGLRTDVQGYWEVINLEQGGHFDAKDPALAPLLDALAAYVDNAIPLPIPPTTDAAKVARGKEVFNRPAVACATCHPGPRLTDSGQGNAQLQLSGPVVLHDVGTCVTADYADAAHSDDEGHARTGCEFDTPSLSGLASSPPYLHDGSAATIREVLEKTRGKMGDITSLSAAELDELVEYLRSL